MSEAVPDEAFEEVKGMNAVYLGAIGDPRVPVGLIEYGVIAKLRFELDLYVNLRPIKCYDERLCPIKGKGPEEVDMVIVRENTEGAYAGMHGFAHKGQALEVATQTMVYTRAGVERVVRHAFQIAMTRPPRSKSTPTLFSRKLPRSRTSLMLLTTTPMKVLTETNRKVWPASSSMRS